MTPVGYDRYGANNIADTKDMQCAKHSVSDVLSLLCQFQEQIGGRILLCMKLPHKLEHSVHVSCAWNTNALLFFTHTSRRRA